MRRKRLLRRGKLKRKRFSLGLLIVFVLIFSVLGTYKLFVGHAAGAQANLWVDTNGGTCARQTTPNDYNDAAACASLSAAYNAAQGGDTINVKCGTYGSQSIPSRSLGTSTVTIQKDPGDSSCTYVNLTSGLNDEASYITIDGFQAINNDTIWVGHATASSCPTSHVIVQNFRVSGIGGGCDHITFQHGDVGTNHNSCTGGPEDGIQTMGYTPTGQWDDQIPPNFILINDVTVHDTYGFIVCGQHTDGWQSFGCNNCTVQNSRFYNNDTSEIIMYQITGASTDIQNILIQNNSFGTTNHPGHGVSIGGQACSADIPNNVIIQNNTFYDAGLDMNCAGGHVAGTLRNNIMTSTDNYDVCGYSNLARDYNVFGGAGCGIHKKTCTPTFVDPSHTNGNVDLSPSDTCAKDFVATVSGTFPATDMHGTSRPQGPGIDAGAFEYDYNTPPDTTPPTVSVTAPSSGATVSGTAVTIAANASDDVAVGGVQFKVDGNNIGSEDNSSPYSISWDSSSVINGNHSLTAVARDTYGNTTASTAVPIITFNNTFHIGESNILSTSDTGNANMLLAQSATLSQTATIQSLSFYVNNPAGKLRLGIYDATGPGGGPGALKAQTAEITPISGWNTANVTNQVSLSAGNYWLAYLPSDNNLSFVKTADASSSGKFYSFTYGALPATFSTSPSSTTSHWSLYATLSTNTGGGPVPGDCNANSHVDITDLSTLLSHFNQNYSQCDFNSDSVVNIIDLSILLSHFGT